jgi:hypothetical protein
VGGVEVEVGSDAGVVAQAVVGVGLGAGAVLALGSGLEVGVDV